MIGKWKTLASHYIIRRPWLTARRDEVMLPDGRINSEYYVLEYPSWVNILAITENDEYVMVRQFRHGLGVVETELCAGVVEEGEEPIAAARRELLEETGYGEGEWSLNDVVCANPGSQNNLTYCYIARGVRPVSAQHLDATEDVEVIKLSRAELIRLMKSGDLKQALMLCSLWKYFAENFPDEVAAR